MRKFRVVECKVRYDYLKDSNKITTEYLVQYSKFGIFWKMSRDQVGDVLTFSNKDTAWQFIIDYKSKNKDPRKIKKLRVIGIDYGH